MAKAKNRVIAGEYTGQVVQQTLGMVCIRSGFNRTCYLDNGTVEAYELITDEHRRSAASGITRGIVGGALLGPVGLIGGAISGKSKGIYQVAIEFKDGKKSLLEVDDKIYKALIKSCF